MRKPLCVAAAAIATIVLGLLPVEAGDALEAPVALRPSSGVLFESLLDPSFTTPGAAVRVPTPSINYDLGCGVIMPFSEGSRFSFEPSADLYFYNAEYTPNGQAVPTFEEYTSAFVLGLLLDAPVVYSLPVGQKLTFGFGIGICLDARVAFPVAGAIEANAPQINSYLWGELRYLTPSTLIRGEYALTDRVAFGFMGRILWPTFNLWSGNGFGFFDQGIYLVDLTIRYELGKARLSSAASSGAPPSATAP